MNQVDLYGDGSLWVEITDSKGNKRYELVQESEAHAQSRFEVMVNDPDSQFYGLTVAELLTRWRNGENI